MKLIDQSFCFGGEGFNEETSDKISEMDKERLHIIFGIASGLHPKSLFSMSLSFLAMFVEGSLGKEQAIDFIDKIMAFLDEYAKENYKK